MHTAAALLLLLLAASAQASPYTPAKLDLVFLLDASNAVDDREFVRAALIAQQMVLAFSDSTHLNIAAAQFSSIVHTPSKSLLSSKLAVRD